MGFNKSEEKSNLYYILIEGEKLILVLYVDNMFLIGSERLIRMCKEDISLDLEVKDITFMHYFLGLEVRQ